MESLDRPHAEGNLVAASYYGRRDYWPLEMVVTVTFEKEDGRTIITLRHDGIPRTMKGVCEAGWNRSFDKLAESLKQK